MASLLIVDDDPHIRELAEFAARSNGLFTNVALLADGQAAWDHLRAPGAHRPDIILTDLSMPRMDGLQLVQEVRKAEATRDIPVVMFSSSNRPNDAADAMAAGCQLFFVKPTTLPGLIEIMQAVHAVLAQFSPAHV